MFKRIISTTQKKSLVTNPQETTMISNFSDKIDTAFNYRFYNFCTNKQMRFLISVKSIILNIF